MQYNIFVRNTLSVGICFSLSGCANFQQSSVGQVAKKTFYSDDPCSSNSRNIGMTIGALTGAAAGYYLYKNKSRNQKAASLLIGAGVGAGVGGLIGSQMDARRCALAKIAQQYNLDIAMSKVAVTGEVIPYSQSKVNDTDLGMTVDLGEKNGRGHFETNSDQLTPQAQQYFAAIADTYNTRLIASRIANINERNTYLASATQQKLLLIGHTDDTGDSQFNSELSERRARTVAKFMKERGIDENSLYFQGAGESLPKADNRTAEGREINRRVEIVEISGESAFRKYLQIRQPKHEYYRPVYSSEVVQNKQITPQKTAIIAKVVIPDKIKNNTTSKGFIANTTKLIEKTPAATKQFDFGGIPFSVTNAMIDVGTLNQNTGFHLISPAHADDVVTNSCNRDRPRVFGSVKSLKNGRSYTTSEYLTGLYNTTWHETLNGNLVILNHVAVLKDSSAPTSSPEVKVYGSYNPQMSKTAQPDIQLTPEVNTYRGSNGVLYRVFTKGVGNIQCMDILLPNQGGFIAKTGKVIYNKQGSMYVTDFKPKMIR